MADLLDRQVWSTVPSSVLRASADETEAAVAADPAWDGDGWFADCARRMRAEVERRSGASAQERELNPYYEL